MLTLNPKSTNSFTQNGNNAGIITLTINSFKSSPLWENGDQLSENQEKNVIISWLCIGHTKLTHSFILKQEQQLQCLTCQTSCTVKHVLIECKAFALIRKRFFKVNSLSDLFENVKMNDVPSFLRETGLYQKYGELKPFNRVQTNFIDKVFV